MTPTDDQTALAVQVSRLYYYQNLTTETIARELGLSRPKVSRLLTLAKRTGLVEIRIHDPAAQPQVLERDIAQRYGVRSVKVVSVPTNSSEQEWLERVAVFTANHLNTLLQPEMVVGLAWGTTLEAVSHHLTPRTCPDLDFVQLNGAGTARHITNLQAGETYARFAQNYGARAHLFPVPTFFDYAETKRAMWRERSVRRLLDLHARARLLVYSVGSPLARVPSHVYVGGSSSTRTCRNWSARAWWVTSPRSSFAGTAASATFPSTRAPAAPT